MAEGRRRRVFVAGTAIVVLLIIGLLWVRLAQALVMAAPDAGPLLLTSSSGVSLPEVEGATRDIGFGLRNVGSFAVTLLDATVVEMEGSRPNDLEATAVLGWTEMPLGPFVGMENYPQTHELPLVIPPGGERGGYFTVRWVRNPKTIHMPAVFQLRVTYRYLGVTFHTTYPVALPAWTRPASEFPSELVPGAPSR